MLTTLAVVAAVVVVPVATARAVAVAEVEVEAVAEVWRTGLLNWGVAVVVTGSRAVVLDTAAAAVKKAFAVLIVVAVATRVLAVFAVLVEVVAGLTTVLAGAGLFPRTLACGEPEGWGVTGAVVVVVRLVLMAEVITRGIEDDVVFVVTDVVVEDAPRT